MIVLSIAVYLVTAFFYYIGVKKLNGVCNKTCEIECVSWLSVLWLLVCAAMIYGGYYWYMSAEHSSGDLLNGLLLSVIGIVGVLGFLVYQFKKCKKYALISIILILIGAVLAVPLIILLILAGMGLSENRCCYDYDY